MRNYFLLILFLSIFIFACKEKKDPKHTDEAQQAALSFFAETFKKQKEKPDLKNDLIFWKNQLSNPKFKSNPILISKIHYNIAGVFYSLHQIDSIKTHMQMAWQFMGNQAGHEEDKVLLYSGLGNIAHLEHKLHQENYYYNRAARMLVADSALAISAKSKITIYFSAGQSSAQLRQFDNAFLMNRSAIKLLKHVKDNPKLEFRAYSQMASCYSHSTGNLDSLYGYIKKMEEIEKQNPDEESERFIYNRKASYFANKNNRDSATFYSKKILVIDERDARNNGELANSIQTGNLYSTYTDLFGLFTEAKQLDSANFYLKKCESFAKKHADKTNNDGVILFEQNKVRYFFAIKNFASAESLNDNLLAHIKQLYESENARAVAEMGALFQLQAKDKSIHILNETVLLSQTKLQKNRLWLAISTLAFLLAVSVALLLDFIQRQRKLKAQSEKIHLEQRLLRAQMEPHFIFNTLSALQSFIRFNDNEKALKYLNQFGRLLRSNLELSRESSIKLSDEIDALKNYLSLQQMRYDDAFKYAINVDVDHDLESMYIPPMLIQPFVENAILHGINLNENNGVITIDLDIMNEMLSVQVKDNGKGISKPGKPSDHKSLSTTISKERLVIISKESGASAGIDIQSLENIGTTVTLSIPIRPA